MDNRLIRLFGVTLVACSLAQGGNAKSAELVLSVTAGSDQVVRLDEICRSEKILPALVSVSPQSGEVVLGPISTYAQANRLREVLSRHDVRATVRALGTSNVPFKNLDCAPLLVSEDKFSSGKRPGIASAQDEGHVVQLYDSLPDRDPMKAEAAIRLGFLNCKKSCPGKALEYFEKVATGKIACTQEQFLQAAERYARLLQKQERRLDAFQALAELSDRVGDTQKRLELRVLMAGLSMELAHVGQSSYDETREICDSILRDPSFSEGAVSRNWALAALMKVECYYFEDAFSECLRTGAEFSLRLQNAIGNDPKLKREYSTMLFFIGKVQYQLGQLPDGYETFGRIQALDLSEKEQFSEFDVKMRSQLYVAAIRARQAGWKPGSGAAPVFVRSELTVMDKKYGDHSGFTQIKKELFGE